MKQWILGTIGAVGSFIAGLVGGWDYSIITLLIFMVIDYFSGLLLAGVFHKSTKTATGGLESKAGFKGLIKKGMILGIVAICYRIDGMLGTSYIRDGVCIAFIVNEAVSIIENAGLMGVPVPSFLVGAIDVLKQKAEEKNKMNTIIQTAKEKAESKESEKENSNELKY